VWCNDAVSTTESDGDTYRTVHNRHHATARLSILCIARPSLCMRLLLHLVGRPRRNVIVQTLRRHPYDDVCIPTARNDDIVSTRSWIGACLTRGPHAERHSCRTANTKRDCNLQAMVSRCGTINDTISSHKWNMIWDTNMYTGEKTRWEIITKRVRRFRVPVKATKQERYLMEAWWLIYHVTSSPILDLPSLIFNLPFSKTFDFKKSISFTVLFLLSLYSSQDWYFQFWLKFVVSFYISSDF